jgi:hypothetical protein
MIRHHQKSFFIVLIFGGFILCYSRCTNPAEGNDPRGKMYAGAETCRQCHQAIHDSFLTTAHFNATAKADAKNILGHFNKGQHIFNYNDSVRVAMEKRDSGFYQVLYLDGKEQHAYRFDILFGYRNAQTSLYWQSERLYELPVSYYNAFSSWGTSPGGSYTADHPIFNRLISDGCFECHSSNFGLSAHTSMNSDKMLDGQTAVYGIDCERCHGPATNHVNYHLANPGVKTASYITVGKNLSQGQRLDACAICHSGNDKPQVQSRFLFQMGDHLGNFFMPFGNKTKEPDVHGNQMGLLVQSKCFSVKTMSCGTCHSPHTNASADLSFYSQKCMDCHKAASDSFCPQYKTMGEPIKSNCIDCHMPKLASTAISFYLPQHKESSSYFLRTHRIGIYADSLTDVNGGAASLHK